MLDGELMKLNCNNGSFDFERVQIEGGYACYISGKGELVYALDMADTSEYMAIENHSPFWCRPFWGESLSALPSRVQALLIQNDEKYVYYLPVCDSVFKTLIRGSEAGFEFYTYSNCNDVSVCNHQLAFLCMEGEEPLQLMKEAAEGSQMMVHHRSGSSPMKAAISSAYCASVFCGFPLRFASSDRLSHRYSRSTHTVTPSS